MALVTVLGGVRFEFLTANLASQDVSWLGATVGSVTFLSARRVTTTDVLT